MNDRKKIALLDYNPGYHIPALYAVGSFKTFYVFGPTARTPSYEGGAGVVVEPDDVRRRNAIVSMAEKLLPTAESCVVYTLDEVLILRLEHELPSVYVRKLQETVGHSNRHPVGLEQQRRRAYVIDYPSNHRFACRRIVATCHRYYIYSSFDDSSEFPGAEQYVVQPVASARRRGILGCIRKIINTVEKPTRLSVYTNDQHLHSTIQDSISSAQRNRLEYFGRFEIRQSREDQEIFGPA